MRVYFSNLGCKLNQAEVERLSREFLAAGHHLAPSLEEADLHVINSCTVTHVAARDSRKLARRGGRLPRPVATVLTGCYASGSPEEAARLAGVDLVVGNDSKDRLLELVHERFPHRAPASQVLPAVSVDAESPVPCVPLPLGHARAMVKIGDGCNMRCTFCIIPFTRGGERYRPIPEIVAEVEGLARGGYREVVVTGVQISSYRRGEERLFDVAEALLAATSVQRLRLTSIAPWDFDDRLFDLFTSRRLCRHVHLSLQSGSSATLRRMRRPYSAAEFAGVMERIRERIPGVAVTTDVIVGFPGETEEELADSLAFVEERGFARVHVFPYSSRRGTAAAGMPGQVPHEVKRRRMAAMLEAAAAAERRFQESQLGQTLEVLWESGGDGGAGTWNGLTDNYLRVTTGSPRDLRNTLTPTRLVEVGEGGVIGEIVDSADPAPG